MKRLLAALMILIITLSTCIEQSALAEMLPVGQLPHSEAWTETIETINGSIQVDITLSLPDITALPIYEVTYRLFNEDELKSIFPDAQIYINETNALIQQGSFSAHIYPIAPDSCAWADWPENGDYAEAATESKQDVEAMMQALLRGIYNDQQTSVWTRGSTAHSRTWRKARNGELVEPLTEHGYYDYFLELAIDGITVCDQIWFDRDRPGDLGPHAEKIVCSYYDEDNYEIMLTDIDVLNLILDDAPIMPIESVKEVLRTLIRTGHLREIYRIELCYLLMWSDDRSSIITVPAWVIHGEYHENASAANYEETDNYFLRTLGGSPLVIPAQTGILLDYTNPNTNRWLASTYLKGVIE